MTDQKVKQKMLAIGFTELDAALELVRKIQIELGCSAEFAINEVGNLYSSSFTKKSEQN